MRERRGQGEGGCLFILEIIWRRFLNNRWRVPFKRYVARLA